MVFGRLDPRTLVFVALVAGAARLAHAGEIPGRKTRPEDLDISVERYALPNGLTVLLSPDRRASRIVVDAAFRAGTLYEPPGKAGLAHFAEHLLTSGTSSDTDYLSLLESRGADGVNAFTSARFMTFRSIVPPKELPVALWVHADRLGTLPATWTEASLARHRRVVDVERLQRAVDIYYGAVDRLIQSRMYPPPHPLRAGVIGDPKELDAVSLADVRAFVRRHITPQNGVLTVVGAFEPTVAKRWIDRTLGALPSGPPRPGAPKIRARTPRGETLVMKEKRSRRPRVTVVWRLSELTERTAEALSIGALLIESYVDGAFGTRVNADVERYPGGGSFRLDLVLPYDKPIEAAQGEAEVLLRYLTAVDMPRDVFAATRLAADRLTLFALDGLIGRAGVLTALELEDGAADRVAARLGRHWGFRRHDIQHIAWKNLVVGPPRIVVHARPLRPLEPKLDWDQRYGAER